MAGQNIQLFILQNQKINVVNPNFQYYNNGWSGASSGGYTAASYPCLTGGTSLISIPIFANWNWVNGAMKHTAYSGGISMDDSIYTSLDNINLNDTYSITYDIAGNTNTGGTITISLYDQNGTIRNTNGRFTEYLTPTDFGTHKPLQISVSSRFNGSITNIIINKIGTEKKYLDLVNSDFFSMNFQTLTDISTKGGTYSFNFDILADGNNLQQLSPINDVSYWFDASNTIELNNNNFFNKIIPAGLAVKDFPFLYGQLIPQGSTKSNGILSTIQCFFTGELRSFADEIGDKKLTGNDFDENGEQTYDLDFSEYDHIFNQNNILASHNTVDDYITLDGNNSSGLTNFYNNSCGFYYSFIDLDGPSSINLVETNKTLIQNIRPNIYVKEIWDKIWEKTSYNYQSNFLNSNIFKSLVIPCTFDLSNNYIKDINGHYPIEFQLGLSENFDGTGPKTNKWSGVDHHSLYSTRADHFINPGHDWTGGQDEQPTCNYEYINFDLTGGTSAIPGKDYYKGENVTYAYPQWTISETGTYNIGIVYDFSLYFEAWTLNQTLYDTGDHLVDGKINIITDIKVLLKNGTYKDLSTDNITEISVPGDLLTSGTEKIYGTVQNIIEKQELYKGDKIVVRVGIQNATNITGNSSIRSQFWMIMQANKSFFFNEYIPRNYFVLGQTVNLDVCLPPNTGQIDFIKDIMNTFCLIAQPVQGTKDILIEPWNDFFNYDNKNDYILWRGTDSSGNTINKIDDSGDIEIETIPDLLYQRVYMHYQDDTNDTNLKKYSDQYQKVWGNQRIQNPYLNTDTKEIMNSFSPTAMNYFGTTKWIVPQIYNVDSRPEYINIPSEETFNKRLWFRNKITNPNTGNTLLVFGNYEEEYGYTDDLDHGSHNVVISLGSGYCTMFTQTSFDPGQQILFINNDNQDVLMFGNVIKYDPDPLFNLYYTISYIENPIGASVLANWTIRSISDFEFKDYQPYAGPLLNPYLNDTDDLNYGVNNYYLTANNTNNNIYTKYWKNKLLTYINPNSKIVKYTVWLNLNDISNLDFRKKIMIDNNIYILNKISDWNLNKSCKVELIQLTDYPSYFVEDPNNWKIQISTTKNS